MANVKFRVAPIYVGSKKVAELQNGTWDIASGDEAQEGVDAYLGHSEGIIMTSCECDTIVPVAGHSVNFLSLILNKTDVNIGFLADGKMQQAPMRMTDYSVSTTSKNGTTKGKFKFAGGKPSAN
jgi:hypothetical protein